MRIALGALRGGRAPARGRARAAVLTASGGAMRRSGVATRPPEVCSESARLAGHRRVDAREGPELAGVRREVRAAGYRDAVVLGMGGSSLAPEVLHLSIADGARDDGASAVARARYDGPCDDCGRAEYYRPIAHAVFRVLEVGDRRSRPTCSTSIHDLVAEAKNGDSGSNFVAITDTGTSLEKLGRERGFRRVFVNPSDIGGRYSALSYFGLAPAAVAGVDIDRLLARGVSAAQSAKKPASDAVLFGAALGELALAGVTSAR